MNIGEKITIVESYRQHWITKARKGQTGIIKNLTTIFNSEQKENEAALIEFTNGTKEIIPLNFLKPYQKTSKEKINELSNEKLLERYEVLSCLQTQTNIRTKKYDKIIKDLKKNKEEILRRMGED